MERYERENQLVGQITDLQRQLRDAQATVEALRRERDEYERKCRDLCQAHGVLLIEHHDAKKALDAERLGMVDE